MNLKSEDLKGKVRDFWDKKACGEVYASGISEAEALQTQTRIRFELEPYISDFAQFNDGYARDVLEIGIGMGTDHCEWAKSNPRTLTGVDLTSRAIEFTQKQLLLRGLQSNIFVADAENLPFPSESFDIVYSWGVLHHSPNTYAAIQEVQRVLRMGGKARIMIYHKYAIVGYLLWIRYALLAGKPLRTLSEIYADHLESPGTQAFTVRDARAMFSNFTQVAAESHLSFGDLLQGAVGQRHRSRLLELAKQLWPRQLIRRFLPRHGLMLLIEAVK